MLAFKGLSSVCVLSRATLLAGRLLLGAKLCFGNSSLLIEGAVTGPLRDLLFRVTALLKAAVKLRSCRSLCITFLVTGRPGLLVGTCPIKR